ncbi:hypothetical protein PV390_34375 [Streptomyces sp. ME02-6991-2A]|uniref:hypothetical protein n=1 Tax=Streptomyces sp. ME02-6991-2A TaxID=3028677 RepID=UPI0029AF5FB6|nr:hypothetical protein [Streptomyces sp. ME02-6991-2A]MDX3379489.1 hypothetical protein [Streptomyces sp. ME02-6991-2A]
MPKKRKKPRKASGARQKYGASDSRPPAITLGGPAWPSRGWAFRRLIEAAQESGEPFPVLNPERPEGYSSEFAPVPDAPRAPMQPGWYLRTDLAVPIYIWVYPVEDLADDPDEMDLRRRGYALYRAHSVNTRGRGDTSHATPEELATWIPIIAPDPDIVAVDRYGELPPVYRTEVTGPLPDSMPHTVAVLDVDYARVGGQNLPEKWDVDVVGVLVVERTTHGVPVGHGQWVQTAFHTLRDDALDELPAILASADVVLGHNLLDGDYRCLRTYADRLDLAPLIAKSVDTLYAARQVLSGGFRRPTGLDLTSLARAHGLRGRVKQQSRTQAHSGIKNIADAEERYFYQSIADDCELTLELWLDIIKGRCLKLTSKQADAPTEHILDEQALSWFLKPALSYDEYRALLARQGTVYRLEGLAREESVARLHRGIDEQLRTGSVPSNHRGRSFAQRCTAPAPGGGQCPALVYDGRLYCRDHQRKRLCRGNPALQDVCELLVQGEDAHCRWHRMTALYVHEGARLCADFSLPLPLPGWDEESDWGFDTGTMSFFARLYRNGTDYHQPPTIWLTGASPDLYNTPALRDAIAKTTSRSPREVASALTSDRATDN